MLVQALLSEFQPEGQTRKCILYCAKCHGEVGPISDDELKALITGKYGDVICFDCEDWPPQPWRKQSPGVRRKLLDLFNIFDLEELPIHAASGWTNDREDVALQLSPNFGWSFWIKSPDEKWQLRKIRAGAKEADNLRYAYVMLPVALQ